MTWVKVHTRICIYTCTYIHTCVPKCTQAEVHTFMKAALRQCLSSIQWNSKYPNIYPLVPFTLPRKKKGEPYRSSAPPSKAVQQSKVAAASYDYVNVGDVAPDKSNAPYDYAVVDKPSSDKEPAVGEVDGMSQVRMPPTKPTPYKGTLVHSCYPVAAEAQGTAIMLILCSN